MLERVINLILRYSGYVGLLVTFIVLVTLVTAMLYSEHIKKRNRSIFKYKSSLCYVEKRKRWDMILVWFEVGVYVFCASFVIIAKYNADNVQFCIKIMEKINDIEAIILAYFGVVISVIILSITLGSKDYYLMITRADVNRHYRINVAYQLLVVSAVGGIVCSIILQNQDVIDMMHYIVFIIYEMCCIVECVCGMYALIIVGLLAMGNESMELYSLNSLHKIFWNNSRLKIVGKADEAIYKNLGYLVNRYSKLSVVKPSNMEKLKGIQFDDDISNVDKWNKLSARVMAIVLVALSVISIVVNVVIHSYIPIIVNALLLIICICIIFKHKTVSPYVTNAVLHIQGYTIKYNKKEKYIGIVPLYYNIGLRKYVLSVQNLMALYCIACSDVDECEKRIVANSLKDMIDFYGENAEKYQGLSKAMFYLPVFVCAYYYYNVLQDIEVQEKMCDIVKLFKDVKPEGREAVIYKKAINSFLWMACQNRPSERDRKYAESGKRNLAYYKNYIDNSGYWEVLNGKGA